MRLKRDVDVAGTHGITTATSMTSAILLEGNLSPTFVVGGRFEPNKSTVDVGFRGLVSC